MVAAALAPKPGWEVGSVSTSLFMCTSLAARHFSFCSMIGFQNLTFI